MTAVELDPAFIRALRLLHSKSKDSGPQLRAMLDDAITAKKSLAQGPFSKSPTSSREHNKGRVPSTSDHEKTDDDDRLTKALDELVGKPSDPKRARLDSTSHSSDSHTPSVTALREDGESEKVNQNSSADDFGDHLGMDLELDCICCVCKSFSQESGNKLMECCSCQSLFHQECHSPPVPNREAGDPRLIWTCSKCSKKSSNNSVASVEKSSSTQRALTQNSSSKSSKSGKSSNNSSSKHRASTAKTDSAPSSMIKSIEGKSGTATTTGPTVKTGSSKSSGHNISSSASSSNSSSGSSSAQMSQAEKRIKLMKKQSVAATLIKKKPK